MSRRPRELIAANDAVAGPVLERIRAERPDAEIAWLCGQTAEAVVRQYDGVSRILTVNEGHLLRGSIVQRAAAIFRAWSQALGFRPT